MNPFLIISAELDTDDGQAVTTAAKAPAKTFLAANDDRYSKTYYGDKAANE
ncbi:MAG: hypothetical protein ACAH80_15950 [Alphaproteobacteria bacterium]